MKEISIKNDYKVYIDNDINKIFLSLNENKIKNSEKVFIITDDKVYSIYEDKINIFTEKLNCQIFIMSQGEKNKNYKTVESIYNFLLKNNADRNSILVAFGGGLVGDIVGFVAATYMRGIRYISVPTTLISQVDSSVGGKVAYNMKNIKNCIGCFYDPSFVFISVNYLSTLDQLQFLSGLGEVIKYGLIKSPDLIKYIRENLKSIMEFESDKLTHIVKECIKIKASVVEEDYTDLGYRNILNFGHTIGHAIEIDSKYKIPHGIAISLGSLCAIKLSEKKLGLDSKLYSEIENLYKKIGIPVSYKVDNIKRFLYSINHDKKMENNKIKFTLLEGIGMPKMKIDVKEDEIIWALGESIGRSF